MHKSICGFPKLHAGEVQHTTHSNHAHVRGAAGNRNREFKKLDSEDEHSLHSLHSFNSLAYPFTSQYIRKPNNSECLSFYLSYKVVHLFWGILTALRQGKGAWWRTILFSENL